MSSSAISSSSNGTEAYSSGADHLHSRRDIHDLLASPAFLEAHVHSLPRIMDLQKEEQRQLIECERLATSNMAIKADLELLRNEVSEARDAMQSQQRALTEVRSQYNNQLKRYDSAALLSQLRSSAHENQMLSERLSASFHEGTIELQDFIKQYKLLRKEYHWQSCMIEKWESGRMLGLESQ